MLGLLSAPTSARVRSRIAENAAAFTFLLPGDGRSIPEHVAGLFFLWEEYRSVCNLGLLFRLDLPWGYLLGAYTDGAYLLGCGFIRAQLSLPPRR
jgi:hypothetical protein